MLYFLPKPLKGILSVALYFLNTVILCMVLFAVAAVKFVFRIPPVSRICTRVLTFIASLWMRINSLITGLFCRIEWDIRGLEKLERGQWYLVLSNHQSWVDILVLQKIFNQRIPMLKFFLKKSLIRVPFLGLAWWALDFPFMERYSKGFIEKNPHLKGKDLEITKKACEKFKQIPVSVMNFVEGTRFTREKQAVHNGEFKHLLRPKAGGVGFVLGAMGEYFDKIIDVTIVYPDITPSFWDYMCGNVKRIIVDLELIAVTEYLIGDYFNDAAFKETFCEWLNILWQQKDRKIERMLGGG